MGYDDNQQLDEDVAESMGDRPGILFAGGVAVGAAVLALVWVMVSLMSGGGAQQAPDSSAAARLQNQLAAVASVPPSPSRLERCATAAYSLTTPLQAAAPAMDQWEVHIGAMNKLVVGAITLPQATAFWNQTRVGAQHRIDHFHAALRTLRGSGVDCPAPGLLDKAAPADLRSCAAHVDAEVRALDAARTAVNTWDMHVRDMERLRTGKLSPTAATQMWLSMWQRGQDQLKAYRAATRDVGTPGPCLIVRNGLLPQSSSAPWSPSPSPSRSPSPGMESMH
ncbi:hypothetical protein GCM10009798_16090 [Nocardioides panacihumi]|uniref:DUF4439 domain-containing protein n=1 Tax=Nocardioides panacihumi TaxID=400774 RepID=A0ABN2QSU4_9ACTN